MQLIVRNHIVTNEGFVHQSWTIVYPNKDPNFPSLKDMVLTLDIRPDSDIRAVHGMYCEKDYIARIAKMDYIQNNLSNHCSDKNPEYINRERNERKYAL